MASRPRKVHRLTARRAFALLATVLAATLAGRPQPAIGQPPPAPTPPSPATSPAPDREVTVEEAASLRESAERDFLAAFNANDHPAAEDALLRWLAVEPRNFVPWYNLACVLSLQGKTDEAGRMLTKAVTLGFADRHTLETDPHLDALRTHEAYLTILDGWDRIMAAQAEAHLAQAKSKYTDGYTFERDERTRLVYVSAFDAPRMAEAREQIARLDRWWAEHVLPESEPWRSGPRRSQQPWVMVLLPSAKDFREWAASKYGAAWERIGGEYSHDHKRLISKDLGSTLRHEYWHVLHWRHQDALGQRHPAWIMEGLCSLVEDVDPTPDGSLRPLPSWRTNQAKRLARLGGLMPLDVFFELQQSQFIRTRPLAQYAQARAIFMFLHDRGKLREWYAIYVKNYHEDRTGRLAFELTFGKDLRDVQRDLTLYLRDLPEVAETISRGMATLPVELESGASWTGGGLRVISYPYERQAGGIKFGDVITAVNGHALHDLYDYARIMAALSPGAEVDVAYVRRDQHATTRLRLATQK